MEFFKKETNINFMKWSKILGVFSVVFVVISLASIAIQGFNFGIDFTGGTEIQVQFPKGTVQIQDVRKSLETLNLSVLEVQDMHGDQSEQFLVKTDGKVADFEAALSGIEARVKSVGAIKGLHAEGFSDVVVTFQEPIDEGKLKLAMGAWDNPNMTFKTLMSYGAGTANQYVLKFSTVEERIEHVLKQAFGESQTEIVRVETVGPTVGKELRNKGIYSVLLTCFFIFLYVAFRFSFQFGPGVVVSLLHDVIITAGVFSIFHFEFSLQIVAALLTVLGYSVNDTVVIYDRVRDNIKKYPSMTLSEVINLSINQSLSRTILTSFTVLLVVLTLLFFSGSSLHGFSVAMTIGVFIGVYSTIYIASPITVLFEHMYKAKKRA